MSRAGALAAIAPDIADFTGRWHELTVVKGLLTGDTEAAGQARIAIVTGPGGAGKARNPRFRIATRRCATRQTAVYAISTLLAPTLLRRVSFPPAIGLRSE
jgi:hypothetical protein